MNLFEKINFLIRRDGLKSFIFFLFRYLSIKLGNCKLWYWNKRKIRKVTKGKK